MHFCVLAIVPSELSHEAQHGFLTRVLARYDENKRVREYERVCDCVGGNGEASGSCFDCDGTGRVTSTYNPESKWDWWMVGGRYAGRLFGKDRCSVCRVLSARDTDRQFGPSRAILTASGMWVERESLPWFGGGDQSELEAWNDEFYTTLERHCEDGAAFDVVIVDCHI